jgi:hypothetical protein
MRTRIFKSKELITLARDQDRPRLRLTVGLRSHQDKPRGRTVIDLDCPAYDKKLIHRAILSDNVERSSRKEADMSLVSNGWARWEA